jgi:hypothetical protein
MFAFRRRMRDRLVFLHIPRCGGSSLRTAMGAHFRRRERARLSPEAVRLVTDFSNETPKRAREAIFLYLMAQGDYRFLAGHFFFSEAGYEYAKGTWKHVTMFRDPVDRWFSSYYAKRDRTGDKPRTELTLEEFVETDLAGKMGRAFVRKFCGDLDPAADLEAAIARAKENLAKVDLIGFLEEMPAFLDRYEALFGVRPRVPHVNRSRHGKERDAVPEGVRAEVERLCAPDREIVAHVKGLSGR